MRENKQNDKNNAFQKAEDEMAEGIGSPRIKAMNRLPLIITSIAVIILLIGLYFLFFNNSSESSNTGDNDKTIKTGQDENFVEGMRQHSLGNYEEAKESFKKTYYNKLEKSDQNMIVDMYIDNGDYQEAIDDYYNADIRVVDHLYKTGKERELVKLDDSTRLIELEQAILNRNFAKVAKLADKYDINMNQRRAKIVAQAYHKTGEDKKASKFTNSMLAEGIDPFTSENQAKIVEEGNSTSIWTIVLWSVLSLFVLLIVVAAILYFFRKRIPYRVALTPANNALTLNETKSIGPISVLAESTVDDGQINQLMSPTLLKDEYEKIDQDKEFVQQEKKYVESIKRQNDANARLIKEKEIEIEETEKELIKEKERLNKQSKKNKEAGEYYKVLQDRQKQQKEERDSLYEDRKNLQNELARERETISKLTEENQRLRNIIQSEEYGSNDVEIPEYEDQQPNDKEDTENIIDNPYIDNENPYKDKLNNTSVHTHNSQKAEEQTIINNKSADKQKSDKNKKPKKPVLKPAKQEEVIEDAEFEDDDYSYDFDNI